MTSASSRWTRASERRPGTLMMVRRCSGRSSNPRRPHGSSTQGYADRAGFGVRNSKSFTSRVDEAVIVGWFVCSKQGQPTRKDPFDLSKKRRNQVSSREGCKAMLQVNRRENGQWAISRCVLEHCHSLGIIPKASTASQKKLKKPWELVVPTCVIEPQQSGLGAGGGVAQSLLEYFKKMQADNPAFFYAIQIDRNNCVANVFWADAKARMAYSYFGDLWYLT